MGIFLTLLSFVTICILSAYLVSFHKIPSSLSPIITVSFVGLLVSVCGMFGLLAVGGYLVFGLSVVAVVKMVKQKIDIKQFSFTYWIFCLFGIAIIFYFGIKQPLLSNWDEFSFWGTAVKMSKINHKMYTVADIGWNWVGSQKPIIVILGYFMQFFGEYAEWRTFVATDIIALSLFVACCFMFEQKNKSFSSVILAIMFFVPYIFTIYKEPIITNSLYMNCLSDVPMAWFFAAVFVVYYGLKLTNSPLYCVNIMLLALVMVRDTALPLALIAWVIIGFDMLVTKQEIRFWKLIGIKAKLAHFTSNFVVIAVGFFGWAKYIQNVTGANPFGDIGGTEQMSMVSMMLNGVMQLFGIGTTEKFSHLMGMMYSSFFSIRLSLIGNGFMIVVIILAIIILAMIFTNDKEHKKTCGIFMVLSSLGFFAFYTFIGFTYVFVFKDIESHNLTGYERYIYPYYIAWFMVAVVLLAISVSKPAKLFFGTTKAVLYGILLIFAFQFSRYIPVGMSVLDFHDGYFTERREIIANSKQIIEILGENNRDGIFFIGQGDDGNRWFQYSGDLLPLQLDYSYGGGTLSAPDAVQGTYVYYKTPQEIQEYINDKNCKYVFVENSDGQLVENFGFLFDDNLSKAPALYSVTQGEYKFVSGVG